MIFILIAEGFPGPVMIPIAMIRNGTEARAQLRFT